MPFNNLETKRLLLKKLVCNDTVQIQQKFPHWDIVKYLDSSAVPWPYPDDGAEYFVNNIALPTIQAGKAWIWSIRLKTHPDELIGIIGLYDKQDNNRGFWLSPEYQGQGLMREACEKVTDYWFHTLGKSVLTTQKASINQRSQRVSLRQGARLTRVEEKEYVSGKYNCEFWEIAKDEWCNRQ
ncbi:GNAT family N-acetyltransferase [Xenorhabdus hominickii]|uniref:Acetyltransferase n=1 Tax=Xenorhabdus hominickii TaxID=351679 RepID=A0A2G0Q1L9_XENHO|nr:GNAT family N-acetyltransferase [Xenorhabdus hominickii]AOM40370.1 acetyltransferase [Xenorhabdus hominickii]PHM53114.1 GNAT family N-acetyltransferase [Xenorhabdus hominickii]